MCDDFGGTADCSGVYKSFLLFAKGDDYTDSGADCFGAFTPCRGRFIYGTDGSGIGGPAGNPAGNADTVCFSYPSDFIA